MFVPAYMPKHETFYPKQAETLFLPFLVQRVSEEVAQEALVSCKHKLFPFGLFSVRQVQMVMKTYALLR